MTGEIKQGLSVMAPPPASDTPYQFAVRGLPLNHFTVHSFRAREKISRLHRLESVVSCTSGEELVERLSLGQPAMFVANVGHNMRRFGGVVTRVEGLGTRDHDRVHQFCVRLEPRMALLQLRKGSRIFQGLRVDQIVDSVCGGVGIISEWRLVKPLPVRDYCTQYQETDFEFIARLCAEAGVYYHFVADPAKEAALSGLWRSGSTLDTAAVDQLFRTEAVVFSNDALFYPTIANRASGATVAAAHAAGAANPSSPALRYVVRQGTAAATEDAVSHFIARASLRANSAEFRDYDPARPHAPLVARAVHTVIDDPSLPAPVAANANPTGRDRPLESHMLEVYEHHGSFLFPQWDSLSDEPALMLRQARRRARVVKGESGCSRLAPGHRFTLEDHPQTELNRQWVVTSVVHEGHATAPDGTFAWDVYKNRFECVPADVTHCPPRPERKQVSVTLTATVVGPAGHEIHTDADGRIQVRFHWDRSGKSDDNTCWIRTMQSWSGEGYGTQFIPRVGMEVVVTFEDGDPDKPLVLGCVNNSTHSPSFRLPNSKTRSGFRSRSSPNGSGFNELSFEDAVGREQVYLHAERDFEEVVGAQHKISVEGGQEIHVARERRERLGKDAVMEVAGNRQDIIGGNSSTQVAGDRVEMVSKALEQRVQGARTLRLEGEDLIQAQGNAEHRYAADLVTRITGNHTLIVGKHDAKRALTLRNEGTTTVSAEDGLVLESKSGVTIRCGTTSIRIGPDGVELCGDMIRAAANSSGFEVNSTGLKLMSPGVRAHLGNKLLITTDKASLAMHEEVKLDGLKILLNSPDQATDRPPPEPSPPTIIELSDPDGQPLARQRFTIELKDGSQRSGVTDADGKAKLELPSDGNIYFPELSEVEGANREGSAKPWIPHVVQQGDYCTKLAALRGVAPGDIWEHPQNKQLTGIRSNMDMLLPGDLLHLPPGPASPARIEAKQTNRYTAKIATVSVTVVLRQDGKPIANEPFVVEGVPNVHGTTESDGRVELKVPVHVTEVRIVLPERNLSYPVMVGHLDPANTPTGAAARLRHLGYYGHHPTEPREDDARVKEAIIAFQVASGITPAGILDEATQRAIVAAHGC